MVAEWHSAGLLKVHGLNPGEANVLFLGLEGVPESDGYLTFTWCQLKVGAWWPCCSVRGFLNRRVSGSNPCQARIFSQDLEGVPELTQL